MNKARKASYTLLEVLIVIALMTIIGGGIGFNAYRTITLEKFRADVAAVTDKLRQAQELIVILDTDSLIYIEKKEGRWQCRISVEKPLSPYLEKKIEGMVLLKSIGGVSFISDRPQPENDEIRIEFLSGGSRMDRGRLILSSVDSAMENTIDLLGYPHPIEAGVDKLSQSNRESEEEDVYPKEILEEKQATLPSS